MTKCNNCNNKLSWKVQNKISLTINPLHYSIKTWLDSFFLRNVKYFCSIKCLKEYASKLSDTPEGAR